jgi:RsiW-degrading membrane proteinase PrsW (M82 family)
MAVTSSRIVASQRPAGVLSWQQVFVVGLILWLASVLVTGFTGNLNMIPTVILLGSFLIPATAVVWYLDHYQSAELNPWWVLSAFLVGGVLGVLAASILEALLLGDGLLAYLGVGFLEELAKLIALLVVARGITRHNVRDGVVLGAAVGFGFAALESSGYAFNALLVREGTGVRLSLGSLVFTELLRGILAPVGHGLWTGILGGVLFGASRNGHLRITASVIGTYVLVSLLHGVWDSMRSIALVLAMLLTATPIERPGVGLVVLPPPPERLVAAMTTIEIVGLALISVIGLAVLMRVWSAGRSPGSEQTYAVDAVGPAARA